MKGYVKSVVPSKSGKAWRVQVGDKFYGASFDSKLDTMVGQNIDFDFDDGKFGPWIKTWGPDHTQPSTPTPQAIVAPPGQSSKVSNGGDRYWANFVSNQCHAAIQAGLIKGVADLKTWAVGARQAIEAADEDGGIPF